MGLFTRVAPPPAASDPLDDATLLAESALFSFGHVLGSLRDANSLLDNVEVEAHNEIERQNARVAAVAADRKRNNKVIDNLSALLGE